MIDSHLARLVTSSIDRRRSGLSLQLSLGLALGVLILSLALVLAGLLERLARHELLAMAGANLEHVSQQTGREISAGMNDFSREIETMAGLDGFRRRESTPDELRDIIENMVRHRPEFTFIGVADAESSVIIAANGHIFEGGAGRGRPVFEEGKKGLFLGDVHRAVRLASLLPKPANGEPPRFLDVAAPVRDYDGKVIRVLTAHLSFDWTDHVRKAVLSSLRGARTVEILLIDSFGRVILAPNNTIAIGTPLQSLVLEPLQPGIGTQAWADRKEYLSAVSPVNPCGSFGGFDWKIVARQPTDAALHPLGRLHNFFFGGALLLGAFAALLAWLIARRIVAPVRRLAELAAKMNLDTPPMLQSTAHSTPPVDNQIDQVGQMQQALQRLASQGQRHAQSSSNQQKQFMTFAGSVPHLVWQADQSGLILYANDQWEERFGQARGLSVSQLATYLHASDREAFLASWHLCRNSGDDLEVKARVSGNRGLETRWFKIRGKAVFNDAGKIFGWVGTFTDIHDTVLLAESAATALEYERMARIDAERVSRMKDEFLSTLSHELRTPLNVIGGYAQMLQLQPGSPEQVMKTAGIINRNVQLQVELISDLLDMSAVTAGQVVLEPMLLDAAYLVNDLVQSMGPSAELKQISLICHPIAAGTMVHADQKRLLQILGHLLSNAIKFSDTGGRIEVRVDASADKFTIDITDNGCGISAEFLPHVFDRFRQEDASSTRRRGGVGLGLAIANSLAALHGGTIIASSPGLGLGSTFRVMLPAAPPSGATDALPGAGSTQE